MKLADLKFTRPKALDATVPPELRGLGRDGVRLLVSTPQGHVHAAFRDLAGFLSPGDLLVVNRSATLPASLPAEGQPGQFRLNMSGDYGDGVWLCEPRWSADRPGPLPLKPGDRARLPGAEVRFVSPYPGIPSLWFVRADADLYGLMASAGEPIHYSYVRQPYPLEAYQTIFADVPGSAEMPSAGRPFTRQVLDSLEGRGVGLAAITLHTGVSSLEVECEVVEQQPLYPERFEVPASTARAVNAAREHGRRVIAVGTTAVRALESAWDGSGLRPAAGFTRLYVHPGRGIHAVDGLLTGFHDPVTSHLAMLYALASRQTIMEAYQQAVQAGYLWHEFGDSHLILRR